MAQTQTSDVIGVRFQQLGKMYHFSSGEHDGIEPGDYVVISTRRGRKLGQVISFIPPEKVFQPKSIQSIERSANPRDMIMKQVWQDKELNGLITCREQAHKLRIRDVKFVKAEYNFEGKWLTIFYTSDDKNVKLSTLEKNLSKLLRVQVDMQVIGPRDLAKILGGHGACGSPRCCSTFITEFSPVSIKMAKAQGISLSPSEITGVCGRLKCCLVYEYEQYVEARKKLPNRGKVVGTPEGDGVVKDVRPLSEEVVVSIDNKWHTFRLEELTPIEELRALQEKAAAGCSKHEGGGCDCGAK
ncbi:MAG: cell fate regulator YaaT (PSP1 superfamily) [Candidatus Promineifilaceae bacterium]|jgi:cell fate regulator YaaT (PSP1 superfamily)